MSSPPINPDSRPLPPGWISQYNWEYRAWFYVNELERPPRSSWDHPMNLSQYTPPAGPPPPNRDFNRSPYEGSYNQPPSSAGYAPSYNRQGDYGGGYGGNAPSGGFGRNSPFGGPPPPASGGYQGYPPAPESRGLFGRTSSQPPLLGFGQPAASKKRGPGMGTALLAGGAGLVGGAFLMDAFEHHEEHEREEAYDQGYDNGFDNGFDDGGGGW